VQPLAYTVNMDYWPDVTLGLVAVSAPLDTGINWGGTLDAEKFSTAEPPALTVRVPWRATALAAFPNDSSHNPTVTISKKSGTGGLSSVIPVGTAAATTHDFNGDDTVGSAVLGITIAKTVGGKTYTSPEYQLTLDRDFWATPTGGTRTFKQIESAYYDLHKFTTVGTSHKLDLRDITPAQAVPPVTARVLAVGGGGGAGGGHYPSSGGGAGGMAGHDTFQMTDASYTVKVGAGGSGGAYSNPTGGSVTVYPGGQGGDSVFGPITAKGGGGSKVRKNDASTAEMSEGPAGGSSAGGQSSADPTKGTVGTGGFAYGNKGGATGATSGNIVGSGGGAGSEGKSGNVAANSGPAGGLGKSNDITGNSVTYAAGGSGFVGTMNSTTPTAGAANTGNGGMGGWMTKGANGGSGIVIVRLPLKLPALP
jgi:hypothetical protein